MNPIVQKLSQELTEFIIPSPFPDNPGEISGAKNASIAIGGGDESGNYFAHYGLGAREITPVEAAIIRNEQSEKRQAEFASLPLKDRIFSTESSKSLVGRVAMAVPLNSPSVTAGNTLATMIRSPFSIFSHFGSFFKVKALAAETPTEDPYGIKQYGIPLNDPAFNTDPESLTDAVCARMNAEWAEGTGEFAGTLIKGESNPDSPTGMDVHTKVNPCKLNESTVTGLGALYTDSVLEPQDRGSSSSNNSSSQTNTGQCPSAPVTIDQTTVVQGIRVHKCIANNVDRLLNNARTAGVSLGGGGWRDPQSQVDLRRAHCGTSNYDIYDKPSSQCSPPTARPGTSMHERGLAIDFTYNGAIIGSHSNPGFVWLAANSNSYGFQNLPSEPWHWSTSGN
jgi:hypothetical protein